MKKHLLLLNLFFVFLINHPGVAQNFSSSNLPIVIIDTYGKGIPVDDKIMAGLKIIYNGENARNNVSDPPNVYDGKVGIEIHGSSSQMFPKKTYSMELWDDAGNKLDLPIMGLGAGSDWILDASYHDKSLLRNALTYKLSNDMGRWAPHQKHVEVILNGQYIGVYNFTEKIKRSKSRLGLTKLTNEDVWGENVSGGYILKIDRREGTEDGWYSNYKSNITKDSAVFIQYVYPNQDSLVQAQKDYIKNYMAAFEDALMGPNFKDPGNGYNKFIDPASFADYFIMTELTKNVDGYRLSTYVHKDRYDRLKAGPLWDYDLAYGNADSNSFSQPWGWRYQWDAQQYFAPVWWKRLMEDPGFVDLATCRYADFRKGALSPWNINGYIDNMASYLNEAQQRNFQQWPILGVNVWQNPQPIPTTYEGEIGALKEYLKQRLHWLDENLWGSCRVGIRELAYQYSSMSTYPNPFKDSFSINLNVHEAGDIRVDLYNLMGEQVAHLGDENVQQGTFSRTFPLSQLPGGLYVVKVAMKNEIYQNKIIKF